LSLAQITQIVLGAQPRDEHMEGAGYMIRLLSRFSLLWLFLVMVTSTVWAQSPTDSAKQFSKDGLEFTYSPTWELSDQSNQVAQQLVLTEKNLDAQIMMIVRREAIGSAKEEERVKTAEVEPGINRLLKQYEDAAIKVERQPARGEVAGASADGAQLRFQVDGQPGATDIYWLVLNRRFVQLFFIRPGKTEKEASICWDLIRTSLKVEKAGN
jgi:hypothetical protein